MRKILNIIGPFVLLLHYIYEHINYLINYKKFLAIEQIKQEINNPGEKLFIYLAVSSRVFDMPNEALFKIFKNNGYKILLLVVGEFKEKLFINTHLNEFADCIVAKKNLGYDFGGYKALLPLLQKLDPSEIVMMNDSVYFPATNPGHFMNWLRGVKEFGATSINYGDKIPHYQSFFMIFRGINALDILYSFLRSYRPLNSRVHAINGGEKILSEMFNKSKINCQCYSDEITYEIKDDKNRVSFLKLYFNTNITHSLATEMIEIGYPFMKWDNLSKRVKPERIYNYGIKKLPVEFERDKFIKYCTKLLINKPRGIYYKFLSFYGIK